MTGHGSTATTNVLSGVLVGLLLRVVEEVGSLQDGDPIRGPFLPPALGQELFRPVVNAPVLETKCQTTIGLFQYIHEFLSAISFLRSTFAYFSPRHLLPVSSTMANQGVEPLKVGILGATGMVGQRFVMLLASHPFFQIHALGASFRSVGRTYAQAVRWKQSVPIPDIARKKVVQLCEPQNFRDCAFVFSGLDSDVAGEVGESFALD